MNDKFAAHVIRKQIAGQDIDGHEADLHNPWRTISKAITAELPSPELRTKAFEAALTDLSDATFIRDAVFAADLGADLAQMIQPLDPEPDMPALPESARLDPELGASAGQWLSDWVAFSRKWSPRAYDLYHEACAIWLLSTIAGRRVRAHMGKPRYTNLYICLASRTSLYAKSTTAEIALDALYQLGLGWMLAADSATPQKFVYDLAHTEIENYGELTFEQQAYAKLRAGTAGQRGWYYDEFGQHVAAMLREGGFMADFRGLLRRLDDTPERYEYGSIGRGSDIVQRPYLALLANLTPDDIRRHAKRGAALWGDGFLARFVLITPPAMELKVDRFPAGERIIPGELIKPLKDWHDRLGLPGVNVVDVINEKGEATGKKRTEITPQLPITLAISTDVHEAFYSYHDALLEIQAKSDNQDLDGNYARQAEKALRLAIMLTSLDGGQEITLSYWARAQEIAERWRAGLHELYRQVSQPSISQERENEERLMTIVTKLDGGTAADVARYVRHLSSAEAGRILDGLVSAGLLEVDKLTRKKTKRYVLAKDE